MPSGLAELEQLCMEPNSEQSTSLHCSFTYMKTRAGSETRLE